MFLAGEGPILHRQFDVKVHPGPARVFAVTVANASAAGAAAVAVAGGAATAFEDEVHPLGDMPHFSLSFYDNKHNATVPTGRVCVEMQCEDKRLRIRCRNLNDNLFDGTKVMEFEKGEWLCEPAEVVGATATTTATAAAAADAVGEGEGDGDTAMTTTAAAGDAGADAGVVEESTPFFTSADIGRSKDVVFTIRVACDVHLCCLCSHYVIHRTQ